ncbi:hypothetical protein [Pseudomonas sp. RIT-PI-S]|uniref:hypothetical protein n=1 Tax=Pseudomonas sp. RIT-PI-S TaxID=3035295 RepID=UPI0021D8D080|nr:hypothetical protein [Pseudomonas sp. RIT-PI-S]
MMAMVIILRVVLGVFWFWAGLSKWIYGFDAAAFLQSALANHAVLSTPYSGLLTPAIEWAGKTGISVINVVIPSMELALGVWFLSGKKIRGAALGQTGISLLFVTCGAISWNPLLVASSALLLFALVSQPFLGGRVGNVVSERGGIA